MYHCTMMLCCRSITQQLVTSGFQFDQLLTMYKTRGLNVLELQVGIKFCVIVCYYIYLR